MKLSIVLPARNEAPSIGTVLRRIREICADAEVIVVNDGSTDDTAAVAAAVGARVISHPYGIGNGGAVKAGARAAEGDVLVFMDADGQHDPADMPRLLAPLAQGYDMVVGARDKGSQATSGRAVANGVYNGLASLMTGHRVQDLTSGFRAVRTAKFRRFLSLLPNGFSYPTTITMAFFRSGYPVAYVPIHAAPRVGKSHIRPLTDGLRFLIILFKVATLYSPLRVFLPVSAGFMALGLGYYLYTFVTITRFTNMSALLLTAGILTFLMGLLSEQITSLNYRDTGEAPGTDPDPPGTVNSPLLRQAPSSDDASSPDGLGAEAGDVPVGETHRSLLASTPALAVSSSPPIRRRGYTGPRPDVLKLLDRAPRRLLDIGCGSGTFGQAVKVLWPDAMVVGLEGDRDLLADAALRLDRALHVDLNTASPLAPVVAVAPFDVIVCADVLEHTLNPDAVLAAAVPLLAADGYIAMSLPNVRHYSTFIALALFGTWPRRERGLHDRTHLHFYTYRDMLALFARHGLRALAERRNVRLFEPWSWTNIPGRLVDFWPLRAFFTYQYLFRLAPVDRA
jgi:glycosyltransferase involved in cell wall biosynthesis/SAM-dependent methyltransferase